MNKEGIQHGRIVGTYQDLQAASRFMELRNA